LTSPSDHRRIVINIKGITVNGITQFKLQETPLLQRNKESDKIKNKLHGMVANEKNKNSAYWKAKAC